MSLKFIEIEIDGNGPDKFLWIFLNQVKAVNVALSTKKVSTPSVKFVIHWL